MKVLLAGLNKQVMIMINDDGDDGDDDDDDDGDDGALKALLAASISRSAHYFKQKEPKDRHQQNELS